MQADFRVQFQIGERLSPHYRLQVPMGWVLLGLMGLSCVALAFLPEGYRPLQILAGFIQMFVSGVVVAQWLPIWQRDDQASPSGGAESAPPPAAEPPRRRAPVADGRSVVDLLAKSAAVRDSQ